MRALFVQSFATALPTCMFTGEPRYLYRFTEDQLKVVLTPEKFARVAARSTELAAGFKVYQCPFCEEPNAYSTQDGPVQYCHRCEKTSCSNC